MAVYLRTADDERMLLDTAKASLDYEGRSIDLTGATLEFFDAEWRVVEATIGHTDPIPARGFMLADPFSGVTVEVAVPLDQADRLALGFAADPEKERRTRRVRKLLGL